MLKKAIALNFLICSIWYLGEAPSATARESKLERLIVSYAGLTGGRAPLWIAKELKLFEKYGLDARLVHISR